MSLPGIATNIPLAFNAEPIEEHDGRVNAVVPRGHDTASEAIEVGLVEERQIELGLAVQSQAMPWPLVGHWIVVDHALFRIGIERTLPGPQPEEVMVVPPQKSEIGAEVHSGRRRQHSVSVVLKTAPSVRTGQQDGPAAAVGEVAWVHRADPQRTRGRTGGRHGPCTKHHQEQGPVCRFLSHSHFAERPEIPQALI